MDWQQSVSLAIVVVTASVFAWSRFRRRPLGDSGAGACGCHGSSRSSSPARIIFRGRKGQRREIVIKA